MFFQELIENCKAIVTKKYFCFEGRADRKEFWMWFLALVIVNAILSIVSMAIPSVGRILSAIFCLATLLPTLGAGARRLHDQGKTGWLQLIGLIPVVGGIIVLILMIPEGSKEANAYGAPAASETKAE